MVRKKVEGNEQQRRAAARRARRKGEAPSEEKVTTGASKQRSHRSRHESHEDKIAAVHAGKQDRQAIRAAETSPQGAGEGAEEPVQSFTGRGNPGYTEAHERVFRALTQAQHAHGGEAVYLEEIARGSGLSRQEARVLLHDLVNVHRLVTELDLSDTPDLGPRFEEKPRL